MASEAVAKHPGGRPSMEITDPDTVAICLDMISKGCAHYEIADALNITAQQVYRIEKRNADKLPPAEQRLRDKWERAASSAVDLLQQYIDNGTLKGGQAPFAAGIATDKFQALSGAPTAIVQHVSKPDPDALKHAIMEAARDIRKADAVDLEDSGRNVEDNDQNVGKDDKTLPIPPTSGAIPAPSSLNKDRPRSVPEQD